MMKIGEFLNIEINVLRLSCIFAITHTLPTELRIKKEGLETLFFISKGETRTLDLSGMRGVFSNKKALFATILDL